MSAEILPFPRRKTKAHEFHAPDGRGWCASTIMWPDDLARLTPGQDYTPRELVRAYNLSTYRDGTPGFFLGEGEELPRTVRYVVVDLT